MKTKILIGLVLFAAACSDDPVRPPSGGGAQYSPQKPVQANLTHSATQPLAATAGDFAFVSNSLAVASTATGIIALEVLGENAGKPPAGFAEWALTSTGAGPAASGLAVAPAGAIEPSTPWVFFLPNGRPQLGALKVGSPAAQGELVGEALLEVDLNSPFPSAIEAPSTGPGNNAVWIVDSVFGPGSAVRAYEYALFNPATNKMREMASRRFQPAPADVDGDGTIDVTSLGRMTFARDGTIALVSFSFVAPAPAGAAGGVYAFDPATGDELGRIVMPLTSTASGALEFVGSVRATRDRVIVVSAQKSAAFADLGGRVAIYRVTSWSPFTVADSDGAAKFDQPESLVSTSNPNAVGLGLAQASALVVDAPFFGTCFLDVIDLTKTPATVRQTIELGSLYVGGFFVPGDPKVSPDGDQVLIGTEAGLLRGTLSDAQ